MINIDELEQMCIAPDNSKAYYRPFICRGDLSKTDIFFVGINPATPINEKVLSMDEYIKLLLNYDEFMKFYKELRKIKGKTKLSRTRTGINAFIDWLYTKTESNILETNIITYPTESLKLLWKEPSYVIENGKDIFYTILLKYMPNLLILHGKETVIQVIEMLSEKGILVDRNINLEQPIEHIEMQIPFIYFKYPNGKNAYIVCCRHMMYYGKEGNSFSQFRNKLEDFIEN